jgi:hypothetical protein
VEAHSESGFLADPESVTSLEPALSTQFVLTPRFRRGDSNCDGVIDFDDVDAFVVALTSEDGYAAAYPNCSLANADVNRDGEVTFDDIDPFVECIVNGTCD